MFEDKESFPSSLELTIPNSANAVELSDIELDSLILGQEQFQAVGGTSQVTLIKGCPTRTRSVNSRKIDILYYTGLTISSET